MSISLTEHREGTEELLKVTTHLQWPTTYIQKYVESPGAGPHVQINVMKYPKSNYILNTNGQNFVLLVVLHRVGKTYTIAQQFVLALTR